MGKMLYLNNDWKYSGSFDREMICPGYNDNHMENVRIPHSVSLTAFNYFDDAEYPAIGRVLRLSSPGKIRALS